MVTTEEIINYYDYHQRYYRWFWSGRKDLAMHYGLWDRNTANLGAALVNTNRFLAERVNLKQGDLILDAGCGVGGSAIWLVENYPVEVVGITLSTKQVRSAKELARRRQVTKRVKFLERDFSATGFDNDSFDVIWAIESVCHAKDKGKFLKEAYRILKKGGRLILADGFRGERKLSEEDKAIISKFQEGLAVPNLATVGGFTASLKEARFKNIDFVDKTLAILPSSKIMYRRCLVGYPLARILARLGVVSPRLVKNTQAGIVQYLAIRRGLGVYGVFYAEK